MIVEFNHNTPVEPGSKKFFQAGQRYVFERERGREFVKSGAAREVKKLYVEVAAPEGDTMSVGEFLDAIAQINEGNTEAEPRKDKKRTTKTKKK